jgi:hypothetical protein
VQTQLQRGISILSLGSQAKLVPGAPVFRPFFVTNL